MDSGKLQSPMIRLAPLQQSADSVGTKDALYITHEKEYVITTWLMNRHHLDQMIVQLKQSFLTRLRNSTLNCGIKSPKCKHKSFSICILIFYLFLFTVIRTFLLLERRLVVKPKLFQLNMRKGMKLKQSVNLNSLSPNYLRCRPLSSHSPYVRRMFIYCADL